MNVLAGATINPRSQACVWRMVHSLGFEVVVIIFIFFNMAEMIGEEVTSSKAEKVYCTKLFFVYSECTFASLFLIEFILRVAADRRLVPKLGGQLFQGSVFNFQLTFIFVDMNVTSRAVLQTSIN